MNFSTKVPIPVSLNQISYNSKIVSFGSCFAENIAQKFDYYKFQNIVNPFGIIFNTVSIHNIIDRIINQKLFTVDDIFFHNHSWHCFDVHSNLSNSDKEILLNNLNEILKSTQQQIIDCSHFIITYGTSWAYKTKENNQVVANCHKMPQKHFTKHLLSANENEIAIEKTISIIKSINPNVKLIFTISPVRHIKDGFRENNVSKSNLISALDNIISKNPSIDYFPSYEIVLDELRDYRFYRSDMLHPNEIAIDYIWQRFTESTIDVDVLNIMIAIENIQKMINHKSNNEQSQQNQQLKSKIQEKIQQLQQKHPSLIF